MRKSLKYVFIVSCFVLGLLQAEYKIVVVAGQSNALNIHSDASLLPASSADSLIPFFYEDYYVPSGNNVPIISTSGQEWIRLRTQEREDLKGRAPSAYFNNFFGPEMTLGRSLYQELDSVAIFKFVSPGTDLAYEWGPEQTTGPLLLKKMIEKMYVAEEKMTAMGEDFSWYGFTWMQGESDAANLSYSRDYYRNMKLLMKAVRDSLSVPDLPFVLGHIADELPLGPYPYREMVRDAQERVAERDDYTLLINTNDYTMDTDNVHFLAPSVMQLGQDMAAALIQIHSQTAVTISQPECCELGVYPNPFNARCVIRVNLPSSSDLQLNLFDVSGKYIRNIHQGYMNAGQYEFSIDTQDLSSGVYCLQMLNANHSTVKKLLLLK